MMDAGSVNRVCRVCARGHCWPLAFTGSCGAPPGCGAPCTAPIPAMARFAPLLAAVAAAGWEPRGTVAAPSLRTLAELAADKLAVLTPDVNSGAGCADGTAFSFIVRKGVTHPNRVLIDFMGGGACWGDRCFENQSLGLQSFGSGSDFGRFAAQLEGVASADLPTVMTQGGGGAPGSLPIAFGTDVAEVAGWTYVFVPYCTQDIHLGACSTTYVHSADPTRMRLVHHNGAANVRSVMEWVRSNFAQPERLAFIGCSAGAAAVVLTEAARASAHYNASVAAGTTKIVAVGDSPSNLLTERFIRSGLYRWGAGPELGRLTGLDVSSHLDQHLLRDAMAALFARHPTTQFAYYTRTEDQTQLSFYKLMGGMIPTGLSPSGEMQLWNRQNLALLEGLQSAHPNFHTFVASGSVRHTQQHACTTTAFNPPSLFGAFVCGWQEGLLHTWGGSLTGATIPLQGHCGMTFDRALQANGFSQWLSTLLSGGAPSAVNCGAACTLAVRTARTFASSHAWPS
jgi:hypothetical protein